MLTLVLVLKTAIIIYFSGAYALFPRNLRGVSAVFCLPQDRCISCFEIYKSTRPVKGQYIRECCNLHLNLESYDYHHHHVVLPARISLNLSCHPCLSSIVPGGVFKAISCIVTELLYIGSSWSSCLCSSLWRGSQENVTYEFVFNSPAVSRMSGSSDWFDSFCDE